MAPQPHHGDELPEGFVEQHLEKEPDHEAIVHFIRAIAAVRAAISVQLLSCSAVVRLLSPWSLSHACAAACVRCFRRCARMRGPRWKRRTRLTSPLSSA